MDDPNVTMEEYISLDEEKARRRDKDNDDNVDIEHSLGDLSVKPLPDVINTDDVYTTYSLNEYIVYMYQYDVSYGMDMAYQLPVQF
nr:hypothetical protein [Tanacetum cinerariifolium]